MLTRRWILFSVAAGLTVLLASSGWWLTHHQGATTGRCPSATPAVAITGRLPRYVLKSTTQMQVYYVDSDGTRVRSARVMLDDAAGMELAAVRAAATGALGDKETESYWPCAVVIAGIEQDTSAAGTVRIRLSAPARLPAGVTPDQALRQVEAVVKTAQEAFGSQSVGSDGTLVDDPAPKVEFFVGKKRQETVLGVLGPSFG